MRDVPILYVPRARAYLVRIDEDVAVRARRSLTPTEVAGANVGFLALHQKCPHLGCKLPHCASSGWFECPCHASQFNVTGERMAGPAPSGMSRFAVVVAGGRVGVDVATVLPGVPIGTSLGRPDARGPHCIGN